MTFTVKRASGLPVAVPKGFDEYSMDLMDLMDMKRKGTYKEYMSITYGPNEVEMEINTLEDLMSLLDLCDQEEIVVSKGKITIYDDYLE